MDPDSAKAPAAADDTPTRVLSSQFTYGTAASVGTCQHTGSNDPVLGEVTPVHGNATAGIPPAGSLGVRMRSARNSPALEQLLSLAEVLHANASEGCEPVLPPASADGSFPASWLPGRGAGSFAGDNRGGIDWCRQTSG